MNPVNSTQTYRNSVRSHNSMIILSISDYSRVELGYLEFCNSLIGFSKKCSKNPKNTTSIYFKNHTK